MRTPLACLLSLLLAVPLPLLAMEGEADGVGSVPGVIAKKAPPLGPLKPELPKPKDLVTKEFAAFLKTIGYAPQIEDDKVSLRHQSGAVLGHELIKKADLEWREGVLAYVRADTVEKETLPKLLDGLLPFAQAASRDTKEVGKILQAWGVPPAFDGQHLLNPDGSATYYGLMVYEGMKDHPAAVQHLSGERLSRALSLIEEAHGSAFRSHSSDVAAVQLQRAWGLLGTGKLAPGETPVTIKPYALAELSGGGAVLAGEKDPAKRAELEKALETAKHLRKFRYHSDLELSTPPPPKDDKDSKFIGPPTFTDYETGRTPPNPTMLSTLLQWADKINGKPLTAEQQEALIKTFPMGESVWRLRAHELWKDQLQGQGVKVAVIDTGVGKHPHIEANIKSRDNFTRQRGANAYGQHGTHVTGTILTLAPKAEIRSYGALEGHSFSESKDLKHTGSEVETAVLAAIDKAVADGNQIINMSLGGDMRQPTDEISRKVEQYAREKGIIFVIAAGNAANRGGGVGAPSNAPSAMSVGALNVNDRVATFSSYGENFDPAKLSPTVKTIYLAPGTRIEAASLPDFQKAPYAKLDGTSMATPHATAVTALLLQQASQMRRWTNPMDLSRAVQDAIRDSARPMPRNQLPADVPPDQEFLVVDPTAAYTLLRSRAAAAVAK